MTIVMPILFFVAAVGLFARRITSGHWFAIAGWIMLVIAYNYLKH
jgi:hypothetical protein